MDLKTPYECEIFHDKMIPPIVIDGKCEGYNGATDRYIAYADDCCEVCPVRFRWTEDERSEYTRLRSIKRHELREAWENIRREKKYANTEHRECAETQEDTACVSNDGYAADRSC